MNDLLYLLKNGKYLYMLENWKFSVISKFVSNVDSIMVKATQTTFIDINST